MDEKNKIEILTNGIFSASNNLNNFILVSSGLVILIFCTKFFLKNIRTIELPKIGIKIPLDKAWLTLVVCTVIHLYFALILNQRIEKFRLQKTTKAQKEFIWDNIVDGDKGGMIFNGMQNRIYSGKKIFGFKIHKMQKTDVTVLISLGIMLLLFLCIFDYKAPLKRKLFSFYIGIMICIFNWTIGSWWAVNISNL